MTHDNDTPAGLTRAQWHMILREVGLPALPQGGEEAARVTPVSRLRQHDEQASQIDSFEE
jgi:hypothetical protein